MSTLIEKKQRQGHGGLGKNVIADAIIWTLGIWSIATYWSNTQDFQVKRRNLEGFRFLIFCLFVCLLLKFTWPLFSVNNTCKSSPKKRHPWSRPKVSHGLRSNMYEFRIKDHEIWKETNQKRKCQYKQKKSRIRLQEFHIIELWNVPSR